MESMTWTKHPDHIGDCETETGLSLLRLSHRSPSGEVADLAWTNTTGGDMHAWHHQDYYEKTNETASQRSFSFVDLLHMCQGHVCTETNKITLL